VPPAPGSLPVDVCAVDIDVLRAVREKKVALLRADWTNRDPAITAELIASLDEAAMAALAQRLEEDDYPSAFAGLQDWHLLRAVAIHRPELARPYVHLVDQEPFDED